MNSPGLNRALRSDALPYWGGAVLVCLLILVMTGVTLWQEKQRYRERSDVFAQNTTRLLAQHIEDVLRHGDSILQSVAYRHQQDATRGALDSERFTAYLSHQLLVSKPFMAIRVVDVNGIVRFGTGDAVAPIDVTDRDYFQRLRALPRGSADHPLLVAAPLLLRLTQQWGLVLARRIEAPNGEFAGVVFMTLHNEVFGELFESIKLGPNGAIVLRTADLAQIDRYRRGPMANQEVGNQRVSQTLRDLIARDPVAGTYEATTQFDHVERFYSYLRVGEYPLYILVGEATRDFVHHLGATTHALLAFSGLMLVLTVVGFWHMHRLAQHRLKAQVNQQAAHILAASPLGMLLLDEQDVIRHANPAASRLLGYTALELEGMAGQRLVAADQSAAPPPSGNRPRRELTAQRRDGTYVPVRITRSVLELEGQAHAILVVEDLTRRRQTEARLHELLRFKTAILNHSPYAIVVTDPQDRITLFNPAAERLFGYQAQEVAQRHVRSLLRVPGASTEPVEANGQVHEVRYVRKDGSRFTASIIKSALTDDAGQIVGYLGMVSDITELKRAEEKLNHLAHFDALTDLPNRVLFSQRVVQGLELAKRHQQRLALLFLDLDEFKPINDTWGHAMGDRLLQVMGQRISACLRASDAVGRVGGDEFVVLLMELHSVADAVQVADKIRVALTQPVTLDEHTLQVGTSVGLAMYPEHGDTEAMLMKHADDAMYQAKAQGRNRVVVYTPTDGVMP
ncbi:MAG: diguanylate cyclase [Hydrogenophaga sp.]|nr:diguanylate cyclase [Hydrogenophaga sp.]